MRGLKALAGLGLLVLGLPFVTAVGIAAVAPGVANAQPAGYPPLHFTAPADIPGCIVGTPFSFALAVTGGVPPYHWAVADDAADNGLPPGLSLNDSTGVLSGTPSVVGLHTFDVTVTDSFSGATSVTQEFSCNCFPASTSPTTTTTPPSGPVTPAPAPTPVPTRVTVTG